MIPAARLVATSRYDDIQFAGDGKKNYKRRRILSVVLGRSSARAVAISVALGTEPTPPSSNISFVWSLLTVFRRISKERYTKRFARPPCPPTTAPCERLASRLAGRMSPKITFSFPPFYCKLSRRTWALPSCSKNWVESS